MVVRRYSLGISVKSSRPILAEWFKLTHLHTPIITIEVYATNLRRLNWIDLYLL